MDRPEKAFEMMANARMNCAQTILTTYCEDFGLDYNIAWKLAQGFGGGMGHGGRTCGAVTGAYMIIGLSLTVDTENPRKSVETAYALIKDFNKEFISLHGSTQCKELIGCDLSTPEGEAEAHNRNVFTNICPNLVRDSARIVETILK